LGEARREEMVVELRPWVWREAASLLCTAAIGVSGGDCSYIVDGVEEEEMIIPVARGLCFQYVRTSC
jgi:hypothetical protein